MLRPKSASTPPSVLPSRRCGALWERSAVTLEFFAWLLPMSTTCCTLLMMFFDLVATSLIVSRMAAMSGKEADDLLDGLEDSRGDLEGGAEVADDVLVLQIVDLLHRCLDGRMVIRVKI